MVQAFARYRGGPLEAVEVTAVAIHGVTSDNARSLQVHGMKDLDAGQLVRVKISGFRPNSR